MRRASGPRSRGEEPSGRTGRCPREEVPDRRLVVGTGAVAASEAGQQSGLQDARTSQEPDGFPRGRPGRRRKRKQPGCPHGAAVLAAPQRRSGSVEPRGSPRRVDFRAGNQRLRLGHAQTAASLTHPRCDVISAGGPATLGFGGRPWSEMQVCASPACPWFGARPRRDGEQTETRTGPGPTWRSGRADGAPGLLASPRGCERRMTEAARCRQRAHRPSTRSVLCRPHSRRTPVVVGEKLGKGGGAEGRPPETDVQSARPLWLRGHGAQREAPRPVGRWAAMRGCDPNKSVSEVKFVAAVRLPRGAVGAPGSVLPATGT